ncbi:T9SS type A sorting domain-containing protein [Bacteroides sedimenti]|uniref:Secretion system C-terminal sorting domain-containing protein n=1 Tax=Bacteroides sedimenti TaxID=2136147 RepID=A0ABN6Z564_9BACE
MKKIIFTLVILSLNICFSYSQNRVGWWKFDDSNNFLKAEVGKPLTLVGTGIQQASGIDANNGAITIKKGSYFIVDHGITPKENEQLVNNFSIVIDFKVPFINTWYTFIQTDSTNVSDGECFINTSGHIGAYAPGYSDASVSPNVWYRLVITAYLNSPYISQKYYLDGNLAKVCNDQYMDNRFSLDKKLLLFADNDGDDADFDIAEVALYDGTLSDTQIAVLGGAGNTPTGILNAQLNEESDAIILNQASDFISIITSNNKEIQNVVIYDLNGKALIKSMTNDTKVNVSGLEKGIYIVKVKVDGKDHFMKCLRN